MIINHASGSPQGSVTNKYEVHLYDRIEDKWEDIIMNFEFPKNIDLNVFRFVFNENTQKLYIFKKFDKAYCAVIDIGNIHEFGDNISYLTISNASNERFHCYGMV